MVRHTALITYTQGDLFKKLLRNGGSLEERYVAGEVILPLLLTLEHLHARSIYHRSVCCVRVCLCVGKCYTARKKRADGNAGRLSGCPQNLTLNRAGVASFVCTHRDIKPENIFFTGSG
jgi:serine/threonine protein kinase